MWRVIQRISNENRVISEPGDNEFYEYFKGLSSEQDGSYFDDELEEAALAFLNDYDSGCKYETREISLVERVINSNFTQEEVVLAISSLKPNRSPGIDGVPAEFIKACKQSLAEPVAMVLNYIIENRDFPELWAGGIRSAVFKSGKHNIVDNFRGITILPIMEKIFEAIVYKRLTFVNEAFDEIDKYNNGFFGGNRTSDNLFILNGLVERQLSLGKELYVCYIDFSKAFDKINRSILFYKLIRNGWKGKVIDTFGSLYTKTHFKVKRNGRLSPPILSNIGVNQGGITSGLMFRKYMSDLSEYLSKQFGVVVSDDIVMHVLWGDDLILFSDAVHGLQRQLHGLEKFCSRNKIIVNETKTKAMSFGATGQIKVYYNEKMIMQVDEYKYLGTIIRSTKRRNQDLFFRNFSFVGDKARKAIFGLQEKLKCIKALPTEIRFDIFDTMIRPIITYTSDVWGLNKSGLNDLDKLFLLFLLLCVKATTSNVVVFGECGKFPPSMYCQANVLCYLHRLLTMQPGRIVKSVFNSLHNLNNQGFQSWVSRSYDLAESYEIDM